MEKHEIWGHCCVDDETGCWIWTMAKNQKNYGKVSCNKKMYYVHRVAYELTIGPIPYGMFIDHKCHNRLCINPDHLRLATRSQNARNRKLDERSTSGLKGAVWHTIKKTWMSTITLNNKRHYLGTFPSAELAHQAYCKAAACLHGEFANFG